MSIVESDGPPSWSLDASETGESTKCPWVGVMELKAWGEGRNILVLSTEITDCNFKINATKTARI